MNTRRTISAKALYSGVLCADAGKAWSVRADALTGSPLAMAGLEEIWLYTFRQWSWEQADDYHRGIMAAIEGLASRNRIGQRTEVREGYWKYKVGMRLGTDIRSSNSSGG